MDLRKHCKLMLNYQGWAFEKLYQHLDPISDLQYRQDLKLFFKSIHGTLNHLLLVDQIWFARLTNKTVAVTSLAEEVENNRNALQQRLIATPKHWLQWLANLEDTALAAESTFNKIDGSAATLPTASCILHVVNHGSHHRGQISTALTQLGATAPEMDLPYYLYQTGTESNR